MISVSEIYGGINAGFSCSGQEVGNERERITVLFGDLIKTSEIDAEAESSVFLFDEKDGGSMRRGCRSDETGMEVFLNELTEGLEFNLGQRIHRSNRWYGSFFQFYLQVVRSVWS